MTNCKGCPFLYDDEYDDEFFHYACNLLYDVWTLDKEGEINPTSKDCKLEIVTYALKDRRDSINFIPRDK